MELTLNEAKKLINYIIKNNRILQDKGEYPISVSLCGPSGIGKSSVLDQIATENDCNYVSISLANTVEPSEIIGYPQREFYVCKYYETHPEDNECKWIPVELLEEFKNEGWEISGETRMGYAIPTWIKGLDPNKPSIVHLDDFTRANSTLQNCIMSIICRQEYISWKLPKYTTIVLSENPDNGDFSVESLDEAQRTRYITFNVKFDIKGWIKYADSKGIDGRAINFLALHHHELMDSSVTKVSKLNARSYTMFANIIGGIPDWSNPASLASIMQIASACFPNDEDNVIASLFTQFIANKLDKLITPEDLVHGSWNTIKTTLEDQLYDGSQYRADIASVITTRFVNYCMYYFTLPNCKSEIINKRIIELVENPKTLLTEDLVFSMIKTITKKYPQRTAKLLLVSSIVKKLI